MCVPHISQIYARVGAVGGANRQMKEVQRTSHTMETAMEKGKLVWKNQSTGVVAYEQAITVIHVTLLTSPYFLW